MRTLAALPIEAVDFSAFGRVYDLGRDGADVVAEPLPDVVDRYTGEPVATGLVHVGLTIGPELPFEVTRMERHPHTHEVLLCLDEAIVLMLSADPGASPAEGEHLRRPGPPGSMRVAASGRLAQRGSRRARTEPLLLARGRQQLPGVAVGGDSDGPVWLASPRGRDEPS